MIHDQRFDALTVAVDVSAIHATSGGAGTYVRELVRALPACGVAPVLVGRRNDASDWPGAATVLRRAPAPRPVRLAWEQVALVRLIGRCEPRPRILHSPHYTMPAHVDRHAPLARVVTVHDLTFFTRPERHQRSKLLVFRRAIRLAARHADAVVCVSERTAQLFTDIARPRARVHVIPHGVDHTRFSPLEGADDAGMLAELGVARPYVIHVGAVEPRKNLADLIDAHQVLVDAGHDLDLVLVGTSPKGISLSLPSGAAGRVKQLGFVHDDAVPVLLRHAAAAAYPSIEEGFGLPVLEALAVGTAVVTTEGSVMADVGGDAVRCVPAGDVAALAGALADAVAESAIENSRQFHVRLERAARYTWHASASAHASLYRSLI